MCFVVVVVVILFGSLIAKDFEEHERNKRALPKVRKPRQPRSL